MAALLALPTHYFEKCLIVSFVRPFMPLNGNTKQSWMALKHRPTLGRSTPWWFLSYRHKRTDINLASSFQQTLHFCKGCSVKRFTIGRPNFDTPSCSAIPRGLDWLRLGVRIEASQADETDMGRATRVTWFLVEASSWWWFRFRCRRFLFLCLGRLFFLIMMVVVNDFIIRLAIMGKFSL